ncbi:hypothetical protein [Anaeromicropila herbilytica]|uniref:Uncharacterized protein n=1 Tax=Anaeromicropila herbilytica TaxID=2785025 RepID=A0A7R7EIH3_9FIRM|nr:hypothetical protein [Anaeromicropila herbilytica]BCN29349.1 hypothetical protein bsdtb5_06440 [Anaeromicropila herbilytica]
MTKKIRFIFTTLYISLIVPLTVTWLFSILYFNYLSHNKGYFLADSFSWSITLLSAFLILSTFIVSSKKTYEIPCYAIGIIIGVLRYLISKGHLALFQDYILEAILIIGYAFFILYLILSIKYSITIKISKNA